MIYIIDFGSSKTSNIKNVVEGLGYKCRIIPWQAPHLIDLKNAKGFILSGAPVLLTEASSEPYLEKYRFITTAGLPVLGICFGHQLIGLLYGARIFKGDAVRISVPISIKTQNSLFDRLPEQPVFMEDHIEGIDLPKGFVHLARSEKYEVEAMKHPSENIYGVQFHPEVSGENGERLIENFLIKMSELKR
ncbi:MAG: gamma-glutamyl-gamma-aminobutyrate hydrolase family protein [Bacteroidetes bacterium]|nr:gamma-glutamyl-gamma-aminobutyrate hydrolase family protein [Bacteroidota bacterium]